MNKSRVLLLIAYIGFLAGLLASVLQKFVTDYKSLKDFESEKKE